MPGDPARGEHQPEHRCQGTPARYRPIIVPPTTTTLLAPPAARPPGPAIDDPADRRLVTTEVLVVLTVSLGLSALRSGLSLVDALLQPVPLNEQQVALNAPGARADLVDLAVQLARVLQLVGWGALGAYLLLRAGSRCAPSGWTGAVPAATPWAPPDWPR